MRTVKWIFGALVLGGIIAFVILRPMPVLFAAGLPHFAFYQRAVYIIILACFLCLYRICRGPTGADRIVSIDILGIMIVGLCALLSITTHRSWYIDIGIAWALQSFISTLALSKFLEGRDFDE
ncbi:MAG: cation:proton antiporter [Candidatus Omnitrophica bacterium]|nr:cation:proton antiporter [Candidatus Omnitrophota bacterium]